VSGDPREVQVFLSPKELGLVHAPGASCPQETCKKEGLHYATIVVDLDDNDLHADDGGCVHPDDIEPDERELEALQEAHELMHPKGTLYVEYCCELVCRHLLGAA
jgi:hypothetical protein